MNLIKSAIEELTGYKEVHVNDRDDIILDDKWKISGSAARLLRTVIPRNKLVEHPCKLGCVVRMAVDSLLPQAESGPNDHRKDAPSFRS